MKLTFPNYKKSILNVSAALSEFLGVPTPYKPLKTLQRQLAKKPKNVVFICFDGLGIHPMNINLDKSGFLHKKVKEKLTSMFPSTTTNATTTLMSATAPRQHGWFGWALYFEEVDRVIDIYINSDHYTKEAIDPDFVFGKLPYEAYYAKANSNYTVNTVFPSFVRRGAAENHYPAETVEQLFDALDVVVKKEGSQFAYCYNSYPDYTMHEKGVTNPVVQKMMQNIEKLAEKFASKHSDTLLVITADHGHIDVTDHILVYKDTRLLSYLAVPPFGEARAMFVKVKKGMDKEFKQYVSETYGDEVKLLSSKKLLKKGVFGKLGSRDELLGDYILTITSHKQFVLGEKDTKFLGHHTGLTEEMLVPLIILNGK